MSPTDQAFARRFTPLPPSSIASTSRARHTSLDSCCQVFRRSSNAGSGAAKYVIFTRRFLPSASAANRALKPLRSRVLIAPITRRFVAAKGRSSSSPDASKTFAVASSRS